MCHTQKNSERDTIQYTIYSYECLVELDSTSLVTVTKESSSTEMSGTKYPPQNLPIRRGGELGFPPDADGNGNYAFFDAANYALIQMTGGVTAIPVVQINRSHTNDWGVKRGIMPKIMLASGGRPGVKSLG